VVAIERLDQDGLRDLAGRTDRLGVLSVYANADPRQDLTLQGVAIDLRNRYRELEHRVAEHADPARGRELTAALERLWPEVEGLASPREPGRGRIAFAALGSDWILRVESSMPVASRVVLGDGPFVHPLLELLDEGRTAGVVVVSAEDARLLEWRLGSLEPVTRMEQQYVEAPHERTGEIGGGPEGRFHTPMREQRHSRDRDRTERFLDEVANAAAELAGERGWERILVSGGERWTEPTIHRLPRSLRDKVFSDARVLSGLDDATLATTVTELVREQHADRETRLVERVREAGGSGAAALGLSEVATALNEGRVDHLVYDPEVRYVGSVGADGALFAGDEVAPGQPATQDPRLTERLVERALNTGARISPVEGAAEGSLRDAGGVAALLRW
jgi:peptide subunit release factor 1 (eRF1)